MKMFLSTTLCGFVPYLILLANGVNLFLSALIGFILMFLAASVITKIDFGRWNPF